MGEFFFPSFALSFLVGLLFGRGFWRRLDWLLKGQTMSSVV